MRAETEWDRLITGLRGGDEHVVADFCRDYGGRLQRLADRYIQPGLRRRMGPESETRRRSHLTCPEEC